MAVKSGIIVGIVIGAIFVISGLMFFASSEAARIDSTSRFIVIGCMIFGAYLVLNNIIDIVQKNPAVMKNSEQQAPAQEQVSTAKPASKAKSEKSSSEQESNRVRCRFCGKKYSTDYNGCPYCKKK